MLLGGAGHLIHIDFGFMLSNSPGGVNFESAPFKLTRELLEVMDSGPEGRPSEPFDYFKVRGSGGRCAQSERASANAGRLAWAIKPRRQKLAAAALIPSLLP